jgi:hypothetical protein
MSMLIILILYVDDILLASNNKKLLHEIEISLIRFRYEEHW